MRKTARSPRDIVAVAVLSASLAASLSKVQADQRYDSIAGTTKVCSRCHLAGVNLKRRNLTGADLSAADLKGPNLHDARLAGKILARTDFCGANLNKANLCRADLSNATPREA